MTLLSTGDRLLLAALLPLALLSSTLYVREIQRTGLARPPVYARPPPAGASYPEVGGRRLEVERVPTELRVGDKLLEANGADLAGQGYVGFDAIVLARAGSDRQVRILYERDGIRCTTQLPLASPPLPWYKLPVTLGLFLLGLAALLRSPHRRLARALFIGFSTNLITEFDFLGGPELQTRIAYALRYGLILFPAAFIARAIILMPPELEDDRRVWGGLPLLLALIDGGSRLLFLRPGPISSELVPTFMYFGDLLVSGAEIGIAAYNYGRATSLGRRRLHWLFGGIVVGLTPMALISALPALGREAAFPELYAGAQLWLVVAPLFTWIAVFLDQLVPVERQLAFWAAPTLVITLGAGTLILGGEGATEVLGRALDVSSTAACALLALGLGLLTVPLSRRLWPELEQWLFPERTTWIHGVDPLLHELSDCDSADELFATLESALGNLLKVDRCQARRLRGPDRSSGEDEARTVYAVLGQAKESVLTRQPRDPVLRASTPDLDLEASFEYFGAEVLLLIRTGPKLAGLVGLGMKRSGDVYTPADLALLAAVADKAASQLQYIEARSQLLERSERAHALERDIERSRIAQQRRSSLLAAFRHDLRQPLHAMSLFTEVLEERTEDPRVLPVVGRIRRTLHAVDDMVRQLLDQRRLDEGALLPRQRDFLLDPLLRGIEERASASAAAKGLELRLESTPAVVNSDPLLLERILSNLLSNAVAYTEAGLVRVRTKRRERDVLVEISDTGPGIPPARQRALREPQIVGPEGLDEHGLGLGIVGYLAQLLGHPIELTSVEGRGSTFLLTLPLARSDADWRQ